MAKELHANYGSPDKPLIIGSFEIQCYVLNDGSRVLVQRGLTKALGMSTGGGTGGAQRIVQFAHSKSINPFISKQLLARIESPIKFKTQTGTEALGYEATILVDICDAILEANKQGKLQKQQQHFAQNAEMLIRGFAKTGIIALIDEATGYQKARDRDALQKFFEKALQEDQAKWIKTFQDDFFEMIFKMKGWTWHYASTKKPQVVGHYINDFVYDRIAPTLREELKKLSIDKTTGRRKGKMFQHLTPNYGHPKLKEHLVAVVALGRASGHNWAKFKQLMDVAYPKFGQTNMLGGFEGDDD